MRDEVGLRDADWLRSIICLATVCPLNASTCCALGAYQGGVHEDLAEAGLRLAGPPDFNRRDRCRLLAGNPSEE